MYLGAFTIVIKIVEQGVDVSRSVAVIRRGDRLLEFDNLHTKTLSIVL